MRKLTAEEEALRRRRREELPGFVSDFEPVLIDFAQRLGLPEPHLIVEQPERFLAAIRDFMRDQIITEDTRIWIITRLGYFIGAIIIREFGGQWIVNEIPASRSFLHYVVGKMSGVQNPNTMVDAFEAAADFVDQPAGRDLTALVEEIEAAVRAS